MIRTYTLLFAACSLVLLGLTSCSETSTKAEETAISSRSFAPILLLAHEERAIEVADFFPEEAAAPTRIEAPGLQNASYNPNDKTIRLLATDASAPLSVVTVHFSEKRKYSFIVKTRLLPRVTFRYEPKEVAQKVHLIASFNDWNRASHPLTNENGSFSLTTSVPPGRHEYKFTVDGKEVVDPSNSELVSNGMGSFNNILNVSPLPSDTLQLYLQDSKAENNAYVLRFLCTKNGNATLPSLANIIATMHTHQISTSALAIQDSLVVLTLPAMPKGEAIVRLGWHNNTSASPIHHYIFHDGKPAEQRTEFSWRNALFYSLMIDRFADGESNNNSPVKHDSLFTPANYQGGDLAGVLQKLREGYFDSLGVNVLWISPVNDNSDSAYREYPAPHRFYTGYHGYWPTSDTAVEPRFGNMALLKEVIDTAHRRNIRVVLDFTANHVHRAHPLFKEKPHWFGTLDLPDGRKNIRLFDEFRLTTWFEPYLPSFDYERSDSALQYMTDNAMWWLKTTGADGFRHDAAKHIPYPFWRTLTQKLRQYEQANNTTYFQVGETFGGYQLIQSFVNPGQMDAQFNFNLYNTAKYVFLKPEAPFSALLSEFDATFDAFGGDNVMLNIMDSHDKERYAAFADGDLQLSGGNNAEAAWLNPPQVDNPDTYKRVLLYLAFLVASPGIPSIYYGDEIAMSGAADPDNRRKMRFGSELSTAEKDMLAEVRALLPIRQRLAPLRFGNFIPLYADSTCLVFARQSLQGTVIACFNKSDKPLSKTITLPIGFTIGNKQQQLGKGTLQKISNSSLQVELPAFGFVFLEGRP